MSLDWSSMYDRRFQARDIFAANSFLRYGNAIFGGLLIPFGAMYAAMNRRISLFYLSILGGIVCFSAFGGKGVLLIPYVAYGVGYILKDKEFRNNYYFVSFLMLIFFIFSSIDLIFSEIGLLNWYIFRRIFYVPAELTTQYLDYFSKNDLYYMSDSIFSFMTNISNEYTKARLIGGVYYGSYLINANTNMYAAAYGDFGVFGFLIVSCLASILARCLNIIYLNKKAPIVLIYSLFVGLVWSQGAFHTSLLSNGVLVGIILFAFIPKSKVK
ncbi:hypothetical protein [Vibrio coralliirubri]|uniref:hypothetical protein n=1 Tax=Vibrio coralliirubri TaxID=1516159 RepID=UPI0019D3D812|nr:hypothetical protein [Vibrio coralliirubri]